MAVVKRIVPTAIAIAAGLFVLVAAFFPQLDELGAFFVDLVVILAAFALLLGVVNVLRVHGSKLRERQPGSIYSLVLIASMLVVIAIGLPAFSDQPSGPSQPVVQWIFYNIQAPIQASLSALLVFLTVTATARLLRVRSPESAVMLAVVFLVLVGQVTAGLLPVWPTIKDWILDVPVMAAVRGILLGVALGAVLTGIRLLLGVERPYSD
jgi:hypothetical protein